MTSVYGADIDGNHVTFLLYENNIDSSPLYYTPHSRVFQPLNPHAATNDLYTTMSHLFIIWLHFPVDIKQDLQQRVKVEAILFLASLM